METTTTLHELAAWLGEAWAWTRRRPRAALAVLALGALAGAVVALALPPRLQVVVTVAAVLPPADATARNGTETGDDLGHGQVEARTRLGLEDWARGLPSRWQALTGLDADARLRMARQSRDRWQIRLVHAEGQRLAQAAAALQADVPRWLHDRLLREAESPGQPLPERALTDEADREALRDRHLQAKAALLLAASHPERLVGLLATAPAPAGPPPWFLGLAGPLLALAGWSLVALTATAPQQVAGQTSRPGTTPEGL